jgi:diguanylate cyclase (GGDEF)-like protein
MTESPDPDPEPVPIPIESRYSAAQQSWDRLAWLAAHLLACPISWVILETNGRPALADWWETHPHTLFSSESLDDPQQLLPSVTGNPLVVDDVARHPNPVQTRAIRAMGGAACISIPFQSAAHGYRGIVGVAEPNPRVWNLRDGVMLAQLGNLISTEVELREQRTPLAVTAFRGAPMDSESVKATDLHEGIVGHDRLTGLPNRLLLYDRLRQVLALARRYGEVLGVLLLDLDDFAAVNSLYGNAAGDRVIQHVAACINQGIRESDTVARPGGDEFMIVLPRVGSSQSASAVAAKILSTVKRPFLLDGTSIPISATIGIALFPDDADDAAGLVHLAEIAVYKGRAAGESIFAFARA